MRSLFGRSSSYSNSSSPVNGGSSNTNTSIGHKHKTIDGRQDGLGAAAMLGSFSYAAVRSLVPSRLRRKWRQTKSRISSRQSPTSTITALQTSMSPADTLKSLRKHKWGYYDAQYLFLAILGIFCLSLIQSPGPLVKMLVATGLILSLVFPLTRQFFLPFLPIAGYLIFFFSCKFISGEYRPPIWVRVLPTLENILYGANLSNIIAAHHHVVLDVMAWLPYGICHFGAPAVVSLIMFIWGPPGIVPVFARTFGYMNICGVAIQLLFPCSPPWYENKYGLAPANYSMPGSPGGLAAIDKLFGIDLYTSGFTASPMVFGAFPSLHAGTSILEALFMSHVFPKLAPLFTCYVLWMWWATMYLTHHYAVDLTGGGILAGIFFFTAKSKFLPRVQLDKATRWDYDYVEVGEGSVGYDAYGYALASLYDDFPMGPIDSDEWTIGSSSSFSSRGRSPSAGRSSAEGSLWEGETLGSASDAEGR